MKHTFPLLLAISITVTPWDKPQSLPLPPTRLKDNARTNPGFHCRPPDHWHRKQVLDAAEAMPESKFNFTPESLNIPGANYKEVRTFASKCGISPLPTMQSGPTSPAISFRRITWAATVREPQDQSRHPEVPEGFLRSRHKAAAT